MEFETGRPQMKQEFLAVFERGERNWSAFAIDVPGTGGLGDTLDETRQNLLEGMQLYFEACEERGLTLPVAVSGSVDFNEFDPDHEQKHYVIEWLSFEYQVSHASRTSAAAA